MPTIQVADKPTLDSINLITQRLGYFGKSTLTDVYLNLLSKVDTMLPYKSYHGSAVIYNNEIHILGGGSSTSDRTSHYKFDGSTWTKVSTLPYAFLEGNTVVYNNEIHILGCYSFSYRTYHYKWDGNSWISVSTLPYEFYNGSAVVYNNEIHILGGETNKYAHYSYDGTTWTQCTSIPYTFYYGSAVIYNDEIHILGGYGSVYSTYHYKYNGTSWTSVSTLPYNFINSDAVIYNNEIHILGGAAVKTNDVSTATTHSKYHYKYNGTSWTSVSTLSHSFLDGSAVVFNNKIHLLGSYFGNGTQQRYYFQYVNNQWKSSSDSLFEYYLKCNKVFKYILKSGNKVLCDTTYIKVFQAGDNDNVPIEIDGGYEITETGPVYIIPQTTNKTKYYYSIL